MICPHCHAENREGAKFCDECGTRLAPATVELPAIDLADEAGPDAAPATSDNGAADAEEAAFAPAGAVDGADAPDADAPADEAGEGDPAPAAEPEAAEASGPAAEDERAASEPDEAPCADEGPAASEAVDEAASADATAVIAARKDALASESSKTRPIDLSGFDEYLPQGSYVPPAPSWRDGGTMRMPRIEEESSINDQKSFRAPEKKGGRTGLKVALSIIVGVILCAAIAAFATYQMELWGGRIVPDVVGMTQADATNTLQSKGFAVRATQVKSDETEGVVLLMDPGSGARLDEGGEVVIHVAVSRQVPEIVGSSRADAEAALAGEGLDGATFTTQRSDEAEGTVLSVDPQPGTRVRSSTAITVVVAEPYTVPSVAGMSQDAAAAALEEAGYASHVEYVYTEDTAQGTVLGTAPAAGERAASGTDVAIQVAMSRGTELIGATQWMLAAGNTVGFDGVSYDINSCDSVTYQGNDTTAFSVTATPFTYLLGIKIPLDARTITGTITWTADNLIASSSPAITLE